MKDTPRKLELLHLLSQRYPEYSKERLKAMIDCRQVVVHGETCTDGKKLYPADSPIELAIPKYISRGGLKLEHALHIWNLDVTGLVMLDAGSSTGGFTDCLLQHGAAQVHSVDVGYNQLDYRLRTDSRVIVHERQNIMLVESLDPRPDAAVADLSFRSITGAASHILSLTEQGWMISLIKPQFEIPKGTQEFSGIVEDASLLKRVLLDVFAQLGSEGVGVACLEESPIQGRKGNREFLALLRRDSVLTEGAFAERVGTLVGGQ